MLYQAKVVAESGSTVRMRSQASSASATIVKVPLEATVDVVAELNGWKQIIYEGKTGYMMDKFLQKKEAKSNEYYVKIKCSSAAEAERLAKLLATAVAN